jgi:hypothetical protein
MKYIWMNPVSKQRILRRITKGRVKGQERWGCYFSNSHIYNISTDSNYLMTLLRTTAIYCDRTVVCWEWSGRQVGSLVWLEYHNTFFCALVFLFNKRKLLLVKNFTSFGFHASPSQLINVPLTHFRFWKSRTTGNLLIWCTTNSKMMIWSVLQNVL